MELYVINPVKGRLANIFAIIASVERGRTRFFNSKRQKAYTNEHHAKVEHEENL